MSVSVVIPALNEQDYIGVLLEALRRQTLRPDEVIVVDGGSSDGTVACARCYPGVTVIEAQPPVGAQRQLGLEHASGQWCVFLDADTCPAPGFLQKCIEAMERRRLDIACPFYWPGRSTLAIRAVYAVFNSIFALLQLVLPSGAGSGIVVRREAALAAGGFRPGLTYDDLEFIRRTARRGRFRMLRVALNVSDRRFRREGVLRVLGKYMLLSLLFTFNLFRAANRVPYSFAHYHGTSEEQVVLVDDQDRPIGTCPKSEVHTANTPLHRAFSVFLFDSRGRLLLQQRGRAKNTWPLVWSNSCCGHPLPGETREHAAHRRLREELGISGVSLRLALPDYRYRAEHMGVVENEICPVFIGIASDEVSLNKDEVEAVRWIDWDGFVDSLETGADWLSPWCIEEAALLHESGAVRALFDEQSLHRDPAMAAELRGRGAG